MPGQPVRILDVGCGNGALMLALADAFCDTGNDSVEIFGFEVSEHAARFGRDEFLRTLLSDLQAKNPRQPWKDRVAVISDRDDWPFSGIQFDIILSSQVLEHVHDINRFAREHARRLAPEGVGIHGYPPLRTLIEPHVRIPFAHRVAGSRFALPYFAAFLWFTGRWNSQSPTNNSGSHGIELTSQPQDALKYLHGFTSYRRQKEIQDAFLREGLCCTFPSYHAVGYWRRLVGRREPVHSPLSRPHRFSDIVGFLVGLAGFEIAVVS